MQTSRLFGLIGYPLGHSFSKNYFTEKFAKEGITDARYELFPIPSIDELPSLLGHHKNLVGLNVTIPYKESVLPYLDDLSPEARQIGAVNVITIHQNRLKGYNSDAIGFQESLLRLLGKTKIEKALIFGTGGSSKAVSFVLQECNISYKFVSRSPEIGEISYDDINKQLLNNHQLLINTTPLGMHPNTDSCVPIPYSNLTPSHFLFDLVYNPELTTFLRKGLDQGCKIQNGLEMLVGQAEAAWKIWNRNE